MSNDNNGWISVEDRLPQKEGCYPLKATQNLAKELGYGGYKEEFDVIGWLETLQGDLNFTLAEKGSDKALVFTFPKPKEQTNETTNQTN